KSQARVHERPGAQEGIDPHADEDPTCEQGDDDPDRRAQHPGREEGADDVELRSHGGHLAGWGRGFGWGAASPVLKASAAEESKSLNRVWSATRRAWLSSRRATSRLVRVSSPWR